jgi:DNA-binding IclR family transcriptional regulator
MVKQIRIENMYNAPVLKKGIEILRLITLTDEPLGVSEIARRLSIVKSTALGILKALEEEGFVAQDGATKKFLAGSALYQFSRHALRSMELPVVAKPFLERLVEIVGETVILAARDEDKTIRVLEVVEPKKELKITVPIGTRFPLYTSALMKVFFSQMKNEEIMKSVKENSLPQYTDNSVTRLEDLMEEVEQARRQGYATDLEEYRIGVRAIAALVLRGTTARAAISIFGLAGSMDDARMPDMILHVKNTAQLISTKLTLMAKGTGDAENHSSDSRSAGLDEYSSEGSR